jgi:hypothetical protein
MNAIKPYKRSKKKGKIMRQITKKRRKRKIVFLVKKRKGRKN